MRLLFRFFIVKNYIMPSLNNPVYKNDMKFGLTEEDKAKPILEKKYGELTKLSKYAPFDFENDEFLIEMKSRRIKHDTYNTLMINYSKIKKIVNDDKKVVFIFNCLDGYYYWDYNPENEFTIGTGGRCDRGCNEYYEMAYIDIKFIHSLNNLPDYN